MQNLPDAPWIREAETFGMPESKVCRCPICGEEWPEYFFTAGLEVLGCSECVERNDSEDWAYDHPDTVEWGE